MAVAGTAEAATAAEAKFPLNPIAMTILRDFHLQEEINPMFPGMRFFRDLSLRGISTLFAIAALAAGCAFFPTSAPAQQRGQKTFSSASDAAAAFLAALQANDQTSLMAILGPDAKAILSSGDEVEDNNDREDFVKKYEQMHRLVAEPDGMTTLYIGAGNWPSPIPLAHKGAAWYFDTDAGKQEILYRRVGKNELAVIQICNDLVDAQREYFSQPHDGGAGDEYAQKLFSDPGKQNGLYWKVAEGETPSPIGPLVAHAEAEGYTPETDKKPEPFQGYYFRIMNGQGLVRPGKAAPFSYIVSGKMTKGFAILAYPAEYRSSGVMTFIVDKDGVVYEKDLGRNTTQIVKSFTRYSRDATWRKSD